MNKKSIIISVLGLVLILVGVMFFLTRPLSLSLEQIFPTKALMYVRSSNISSDLEAISQHSFWKSIGGIDIVRVLEKNKVSVQDVKRIKELQKDIDLFLKSPLTPKLLGKEIAMGIYEKSSSEKIDSLDAYDALFATRLDFSFQMAEFFISMAKEWSDDLTTTIENYQGSKIVHVHFKKRNIEIQYMRIKDVLFASLAPSPLLHEVWKIYHKTAPSLSMDSDFSKALSHTYVKGHGIFYMNFENFSEFLKNHAPQKEKKVFDSISEGAAGFKSYTISFLPGEISKIKMIMNFETQKLNPYWKSMLDCSQISNPSLKFVPHNVMAYQWGECYDFNHMFDGLKDSELAGPQKEVDLLSKKIQKRFDINLKDDVLNALGSQVGGYLSDIDTQGMFPYPRMVIFIKFKDRAAGEALLKKFRNTPLGILQQEEYQQKFIYSFTLPLGANMDLGYTFLDDFLLLGTSKQLLKTSIDAFNSADQSFQSTEIVKQFNISSETPSQAVAFVKMDDIATRLQQLLDWYNKMMSSQITSAFTAQQQGASQKKELDEELASKKEELTQAQKKLKELKAKPIPTDISPEEQASQKDILDHLASDVDSLKEELDSYQIQKKELDQALINYEQKSEEAKLWLFNSDEVFVPILKGLSGINAVGLQLHTTNQISETEIFIK